MTGFSNIIHIEKALKQISIDGLKKLGQGVYGECYKVDDEKILKLYFDFVDDDVVAKEKEYTKAAFIAGIPTAISFDLVASGSRKGVLYELLNARTLSELITEDPSRLKEYVKLFTATCKQIHSKKGDINLFPNAADICIKSIKNAKFISDVQKEKILNDVARIKSVDTYLHGDLHTSNIMVQDNEPFLIDMGDFSIGNPMFDIGQIYNIFFNSKITRISEKAVGMSPDLAFAVWELFEEFYFGVQDVSERKEIRKQAAFFGNLRMFMFIDSFGGQPNMEKWLLDKFMVDYN